MPDEDHRKPDAGSVHFSQGGLSGGGGGISVSAALIPVALFGGLGLSLAGFFALARYPWLPVAIRAVIITAIFLIAMLVLTRSAVRGYRRVMNALKMPMEMDPAAQFNVVCWPDQMQRLRPLIPASGTSGAFEPEACRVLYARRTSLASKLQTVQARRRWLAAVVLLPIVINVIVQLFAHNLVDRRAVLGTLVLVLLLPIAWGFIRPSFIRVSPGRVDIVRFGFLGSRPSVETHSLRDAPVRIDLRKKELLIGGWHPSHPAPENEDDPGEDPPPPQDPKQSMVLANQTMKDAQASLASPAQIRALVIIPLWATTDGRTLEDAVFRAAVSTAEPGPLPDDRLIG